MIRLAAPGYERLEVAATLDVSIGGTESNVAVALARLGRRVTWISALPANPLGRRIAATLQSHGVDTSYILWQEHSRAGIYFLEPGAPPRPTRVIYDRAASALATIDPDSVPYDQLGRADALHLTGITPALSDNSAEVCQRLMTRARSEDIPLIFDVNYRSLLWSPEEAASGLVPFLDQAHILFCGRGDAATIWNFEGSPEEVAAALLERSGAELVVITDGGAGATAVTRSGEIRVQAAPEVDIVDPVGAGDGFAAGFLDVWFSESGDITRALRSGVALASIQMTMPGDLAIITPAELSAAIDALDHQTTDIVR
jgi:2-dehydro-3-deoxygluconokinase